MKKCSSGILFWVNVISSFLLILLCIFMLSMYVFYFPVVNKEYPFIVSFIVVVPFILISLSILIRYSKCYYIIKDKEIELSLLTIKKKKKWHDDLRVSKFLYKYTYQSDVYKFNVDNVLQVGLRNEVGVSRPYYKKNDVVILLDNNKKIWIKKGIYSKKQIREIVSFIKKNKKTIIGDNLKKEYNII